MTDVLGSASVVFWDFDGVIKESLDVKTRGFVELFAGYGADVASRVKAHHERHGGMSRYEKIPQYLRYAGEEVTEERVRELCARFSRLVLDAVVASPWVPGVERYLRDNPNQQTFVLVSATPQDELHTIVDALHLTGCFGGINGAPIAKADAIRQTIERRGVRPGDTLMVGDAHADLEAARINGVPFLLRRHAINRHLFEGYAGPSFEDLTA